MMPQPDLSVVEFILRFRSEATGPKDLRGQSDSHTPRQPDAEGAVPPEILRCAQDEVV